MRRSVFQLTIQGSIDTDLENDAGGAARTISRIADNIYAQSRAESGAIEIESIGTAIKLRELSPIEQYQEQARLAQAAQDLSDQSQSPNPPQQPTREPTDFIGSEGVERQLKVEDGGAATDTAENPIKASAGVGEKPVKAELVKQQ